MKPNLDWRTIVLSLVALGLVITMILNAKSNNGLTALLTPILVAILAALGVFVVAKPGNGGPK